MGYVKSMLPDDWESKDDQDNGYFPTKLNMHIQINETKYKYLCRSGVFNPNIRDKWLPRWYDIPFEECLFASDWKDSSGTIEDWKKEADMGSVMLLTDLPKGINYKQHLKILKTERLLDGC